MAVIGGSATKTMDGSISGVKPPESGNVIDSVDGILGVAKTVGMLSGETVDETFDPAAVVADDTLVTNPGTTTGVSLINETPEQAAYRKTMKVFNDAGGGEAGKAAVLQALGDNNLSLQDLADQTGVALEDIQTFLYPVSDNTTKTLTTAEMLAALNNLTGTGLKKVDSTVSDTVSDIDKINTVFGNGTELKSETDVYKKGQIESPDPVTGGITALGDEAIFTGGLAALDDEAIFKGGSAAVDDEATFKGGSAAIKGKVDAVGNVDALPNKISAEGNVIDDSVYTTTITGKVGDQFTSDTPTGKVDKVETDYDFTGAVSYKHLTLPTL